ncbi:hypothetical protein N7495_000707 [Penicillium taxi]|uniref:uncharacterized protein n=1 Tax=Penicillium taxi TaxID=168475 RepID=UPI00254523C9|nr:uncharacterized protein N7495_000707 [Penicillium taxi]KAJ5908025.1 hypothetical protein N7495_000707 [Penicillium taxi]
MAEPQVATNGTHAAHQGFPEYPAATPLNTVSTFQPAQSSTPTSATGTEQQNEITKDEVGWFFVEQYYTTMSRNPDKLHLFYSKRSQLIFGTEAETIPVAIGTKAINEKIKNLDFQDCKVRVQNVDSQESFENILVAVIGEISNKSEPSRKFSQTFVLAEQPNGYYVLNDIFRYLVEEEEETVEEATFEAVPESAPVVESTPVAEVEVKGDEIATPEAEVKAEEVNDTPAPVPVVESEPEAVVAEKAVTKDIETPGKAAPVEKPASPTPAVPLSWASIASSKAAAAAAAAAAPKAPAVTAAPKATAAATPAATVTPSAPVVPATQPVTTPTPVAEKDTSSDSAGWQTAGVDKKTQARAAEEPPVLAFIKNVGEKVDAALLKAVLNRYGKLKYFDVARGKNCAFVEFAEPAGYSAAFAANPVQVGDQQVIVEERRARGSYGTGYTGRGGPRGRNDRPGSQGRGGFQRGEGRGAFNPRGRGGNANGNVASKGRNQPQAA